MISWRTKCTNESSCDNGLEVINITMIDPEMDWFEMAQILESEIDQENYTF